MNSPSPKTSKKASQNLWQKVGQKFHLSNSNAFHGSLSSLNDLPDSCYHRALGDPPLEHEHTVSLQNLPQFNPDSPKVKLRKKHGTFDIPLLLRTHSHLSFFQLLVSIGRLRHHHRPVTVIPTFIGNRMPKIIVSSPMKPSRNLDGIYFSGSKGQRYQYAVRPRNADALPRTTGEKSTADRYEHRLGTGWFSSRLSTWMIFVISIKKLHSYEQPWH